MSTEFVFIDEPKQWNNKCPQCRSNIRWSLSNSKPGAEAGAYCSKGVYASRLDIRDFRKIRFCTWEGRVVRQKDGGIRFKDKDGNWI